MLQVETVHFELRHDPTPLVKTHLVPTPPLREAWVSPARRGATRHEKKENKGKN